MMEEYELEFGLCGLELGLGAQRGGFRFREKWRSV